MSLFQGKSEVSHSKTPSRANVVKKKDDSRPKRSGISRKQSWFCFCFICEEERVADMKAFLVFEVYVDEECVGNRAKDKCIYLKCPECEYTD
jgi:hypothetical protein